MEEKAIMMEDMELQAKCVEAGKKYLELMWPGMEDIEKRAYLQNACAAGYSKGYRDAQAEFERTSSHVGIPPVEPPKDAA